MAEYLYKTLSDFLEKVFPFTKTISHIHLAKDQAGHGMFAADSKDRSISFHARTKAPMDDLKGVGCFGNLAYLKQILNSSFIKNAAWNISYREQQKRPPTVGMVRFVVDGKSDLMYQATDPFLGTVAIPGKLKINSWPVTFLLSEDAFDNIAEMNQIQAASAVSAEILCTLLAEKSGVISMLFGNERNESSLFLTDQVDREDTGGFQAQFLTEHLIRLGGMVNWKTQKEMALQFAQPALKAVFETVTLEYEVILTAKKKSK